MSKLRKVRKVTGFCQNPLCENPATVRVLVSVARVGDENRRYCATCEEVFSTGVQHGKFLGRSRRSTLMSYTAAITAAFNSDERYRAISDTVGGESNFHSMCAQMAEQLEAVGTVRGNDWDAKYIDVIRATVDLLHATMASQLSPKLVGEGSDDFFRVLVERAVDKALIANASM